MARIVFSISNLVSPISRLQELYTVIPQGRALSVLGAPRVIYFLGDNVELLHPDGRILPIGEGDVLVAPGGIQYRLQARDRHQKARNHVLVITFEEKASGETVGMDSPVSEHAFQRLFSQGLHLFPDALNHGSARAILHVIRREADKNERPNPLLISGLCTALVSSLLTGEEESPGHAAPLVKGEAAVEHACQYMRQFLQEKLTLSQIAWEVQLGGEHLARLFRFHRGSTVFEFLDEIRIEKVCQLLKTTELSVVRIAPLCGFPTSALLARHFKARTGQTPLAYRLEARRQEKFRPSSIESPPEKPPRISASTCRKSRP